MGFLFPPESAARLDSDERLRLLPVEAMLRVLPLKKGTRFLDVGCGTGTFFFPVFEKLKGQGVFIAAELQEEMLRLFLSRLESYAEAPGYTRIEVCRAKPDRLPLPNASADVILLSQVYHEIGDRPKYLQELKRVLAPQGTLCLLDWRTPEEDPELLERPPMGPPYPERVSERVALLEIEEAGLRLPVSVSGFQHNWCLTVRK